MGFCPGHVPTVWSIQAAESRLEQLVSRKICECRRPPLRSVADFRNTGEHSPAPPSSLSLLSAAAVSAGAWASAAGGGPSSSATASAAASRSDASLASISRSSSWAVLKAGRAGGCPPASPLIRCSRCRDSSSGSSCNARAALISHLRDQWPTCMPFLVWARCIVYQLTLACIFLS